MNKKTIITIGGKLGSGKSTAAKVLAKKIGYEHYSTGDIFRKIATERGLTVTELNIEAEKDSSIDKDIDSRTKELNNSSELVLDSRLAFHFVPDSFKVYFIIDPEIAAQRMFLNLAENEHRKNSEASYSDVLELGKDALARYESENKRFEDLYNVNPSDQRRYDLVIDTGLKENTLEVVVDRIIEKYNEWKNS